MRLVDHVDFFKIASYDLLWHELHPGVRRDRQAAVLSTGMATLDEVAAGRRGGRGPSLSLLHCVSGYPTPPQQANLAAIGRFASASASRSAGPITACSEPVVRRASRAGAQATSSCTSTSTATGCEAGEHNWSPRRLRALIASAAAIVRREARAVRWPDAAARTTEPRSEGGQVIRQRGADGASPATATASSARCRSSCPTSPGGPTRRRAAPAELREPMARVGTAGRSACA